ncbi:MAG: hypothetical protein ABIN35_00735 [candidate division WOR-3 bacterium]
MPAFIKDAFRSPLDRRNPGHIFYDINSFTRSSSTASIRNEYYQSNLPSVQSENNTDYRLNQMPTNDHQVPNFGCSPDRKTDKPPTLNTKSVETDHREDRDKEQKLSGTQERDNGNEMDLINKILVDRKYRKLLREMLLDNKDEDVQPPKTKTKSTTTVGFQGLINYQTIMNILIYYLGGLIILFIVDLVFSSGQLLTKIK